MVFLPHGFVLVLIELTLRAINDDDNDDDQDGGGGVMSLSIKEYDELSIFYYFRGSLHHHWNRYSSACIISSKVTTP